MAIYRTNTEELTSIADAIRAKTGDNSSLVYPTGFVSAIQNIPYNWMGEDATFIDTLYEHTYKLSDTSFNASDVSTSNTTILSSTNLESRYLPAQYDYILKLLVTTDYQYTITLTNTAHILEGYFCGVLPFGQKPMTNSDFTNNTMSYVSNTGAYAVYNNLFINNSGTQEWTANGYGITFSMNGPSLSNQQADTFGLTVALPPIRVNYHNSYMKQEAINALDVENTTIHMKYELYRCKQNDIWHGAHEETIKLYQAKHNIT